MAQELNWTEVLVTLITAVASFFAGHRRGSRRSKNGNS